MPFLKNPQHNFPFFLADLTVILSYNPTQHGTKLKQLSTIILALATTLQYPTASI